MTCLSCGLCTNLGALFSPIDPIFLGSMMSKNDEKKAFGKRPEQLNAPCQRRKVVFSSLFIRCFFLQWLFWSSKWTGLQTWKKWKCFYCFLLVNFTNNIFWMPTYTYNFICLLNILKLIKNKECLLQIFVLNVYKSLNDYFSEAFSARMLRK